MKKKLVILIALIGFGFSANAQTSTDYANKIANEVKNGCVTSDGQSGRITEGTITKTYGSNNSNANTAGNNSSVNVNAEASVKIGGADVSSSIENTSGSSNSKTSSQGTNESTSVTYQGTICVPKKVENSK